MYEQEFLIVIAHRVRKIYQRAHLRGTADREAECMKMKSLQDEISACVLCNGADLVS